MNLKKYSEKTGTQMTLFSQEVFLASHTQPLGSDLEKKMNATCGPKCLESFVRFNRNGLWAKTFSALLIGQEGWFSRRCRLTWKVKGTKYNRMYFQLRVSTLPTKEIEFGLLHIEQQHLLKTPTAMDGEVTSGKKNPVSGNSGTLAQEIMSGYKPTMEKLGLLPTPRAMTINNKEERITPEGRMSADGKQRFGLNLQDMATVGLLPTPESFDWNSARHPELWERDKKKYAEKGINLHCNLRQMARLSLLPTPISSEIHHSERVKKLKESGAETMASRKLGASRPNGLMDFLDFNQMLPTPNCMDTLPPKEGAAMERIANGARKGRTAPSNLREYVNPKSWEAYQMFPTPTSGLEKHSDKESYWKNRKEKGRQEDLQMVVHEIAGYNSQLNPLFVGEMMGFPPNWLELPFQNTETNP